MSAEETAAIARITAAIEAQKSVNASVLSLLGSLAQQLRDLAASDAADAASINALADQIETESQRLSDAVTANTAAETEEPTPVEPTPEVPAEPAPVEPEAPVEAPAETPPSEEPPVEGSDGTIN